MIERAIENWLTNTNERNYQTAFCQVLLHKGYRVLTIPSHGPMEQGKDVIAVAADGIPCAYQLKTGAVDLPAWRKYRDEVKELMELPISHPSIDKSRSHRAFLVANGEMTNDVRVQIDQMNEDNARKGRQYAHLDVITLRPLLADFIGAQGKFIPRELEDFRAFLDLYLADGADFFPKAKFVECLENVLLLPAGKRPSDVAAAISSSVIFTCYVLHPFQLRENHYAAFEAWTCLGATILRRAHGLGLEPKLWHNSFDLVFAEMIRSLSSLRAEALGRVDFLEGDALVDGGLLYSVRTTIVLGAMSALTNWLHRQRVEDESIRKTVEVITANLDHAQFFWGESVFPFMFHIIKLLESMEEPGASECLERLFRSVFAQYDHKEKLGPLNLYFGPAEVLASLFGASEEELNLAEFYGESMILRPLIGMLARRNQRALLVEHWRPITRILFQEFRPDRVEDLFAWRSDDGDNHEEWPKQTQSWAELQREASDLTELPPICREQINFLWFFVLVFPHRANDAAIRLLDMEFQKQASNLADRARSPEQPPGTPLAGRFASMNETAGKRRALRRLLGRIKRWVSVLGLRPTDCDEQR